MTSTAVLPPAPPAAPEAAVRRARRGFVGYDVANSAWVTVVITAVGGPYLDGLARAGGPVSVLGLQVTPGLVLPATLVAAVLVQVVLLPLLGRQVDRGVAPAGLVRRFALLGAAAGLVLAAAPSWPVAALATVAAAVCFGAAMVPYNALLPRLAPGREADGLSSRAYATGYLGGALLLAGALGLLAAEPLEQGALVRVVIAAAACWWAGVAVLSCRAMSAAPARAAHDPAARAGAIRLLRDLPQLRLAVVASLLLGDAVGAVVALSATVLTFELWVSRGLPAAAATSTLLMIVLVIQVLAAPAALVCGRAARRFGTRPVLLACLAGWVVVLTYAVLSLDDVRDAFVLAVGVAMVLGGTQTLARSLVSQCTPPAHAGAVFSLTQLAERGTAWVGPTVFGVVVATTGSYRGALASLVVLFVAAALVLGQLRLADGVTAAAGYDPVAAQEARRLALPDGQVPTTRGRVAYALIARVLGALLATLCRTSVRGALPAGGVVVVANHRSVVDGPLLGVVGTRLGRQLRMLGTAGVFTAPVVGPVLLAAGMVPVKRRSDQARAAVAGAQRLLEAGEAVALFPEGRIQRRADGSPDELKTGAARLALAAGVPVVAVGLVGTDALVRPGTHRPAVWPGGRRVRVRVQVSAPLDLAALLGLAPGPHPCADEATVAAATALLHRALTEQVRGARG